MNGFKYKIDDSGVIITGYTGAGGDVVVPSTVSGFSVTFIGQNAFNYCTGLTSITLPNSVTTIGYKAFDGCTGLTSITLGNSLTTIGNSAFKGCTGLISVTLPNSITTIGYYAFEGCTGLTSINLPNSITRIGDQAFDGCTGLTSITLSNSLTTIGDLVFYGCTGLTSITLPNSVTTIGDAAFRDCTGLTSITLPNSITTIGKKAFWDCTSLTSITLPDSITTIGDGAFWGCTGLTRRTPGLKEGSNDKEVKKGDVSKSELCPFCGVLNKSGKNDVCKHRIGWVDKWGLTRSDQMESLESVWTSLAGKIEQIRAYTQKGLAKKSGASLKTIRLFLKNVEEDHAEEFDIAGYRTDDSGGGVDSDTVFPPIFGLCGGEIDCQTKKGIPCLKSNFIYCKDPDSLEEHISDLELLNEFLDEEGNGEGCPFCGKMNNWGEMNVCEHHIGMAFDGVIESEELERLKNVWMSLADKIEQLSNFRDEILAKKSGASLQTIRLFLENAHRDLSYESDLDGLFGICFGDVNSQPEGMLSGCCSSIYCEDSGVLEEHTSDLELLDDAFDDDAFDKDEGVDLCHFCGKMNNWREMNVCEHHIGMVVDGKTESDRMERLTSVWKSLAKKMVKIRKFTQKKLAEISGASKKNIRLFLKNGKEDHADGLDSEQVFDCFFGLCFGDVLVQSEGMPISNCKSIYCGDSDALEDQISDLILLDKVFPEEVRPNDHEPTGLNSYKKAITDCTKAIELDPKSAIAYNNRGFAYGELKQYDKAIADYTKAIELNPKSAFAYRLRGQAYLNMGKKKEANADFAKAKMLDEGN